MIGYTTGIPARTVALLLLLAVGGGWARNAHAASSIASWQASSPDDLSGFPVFGGDNQTVNVTLPFTFTIEGVGYTTLVMSSNGWIEFGSNTSGSSDPINTCLPTASHTNPFLATYWDDMSTTGTAIRYGTVGTSPNRTWLADVSAQAKAQLGPNVVHYQVQLHETSNVITVKYISSSSNANGWFATIGYQGAGGATATTVQPLSCNGGVLDDTHPGQGFSVDVGRSGLVTLAAQVGIDPVAMVPSTQISGLDNVATVGLPFSVTLEGTSYNTIAISTNGWLEFGGNSCTTCGTNNADSVNTALPTSKHTRPFLAPYWDDSTPIGTFIRYRTFGTSPNRTFAVDYQVDTDRTGGGSDDISYQVMIHEGSNLINVTYRDCDVFACGQSATIGFQGAGGASAVAYPLSFNAETLSWDNDRQEGWSIHPKPAGGMSLHALLMDNDGPLPTDSTLSGSEAVANVTLPFTVTIDGTSYTTLTLSTNGWLEIGGDSSGGSDPNNVALPASNHVNPFVAMYWDDLRTSSGGSIEYGTDGTSPNRIFRADYSMQSMTTTGLIGFHVQIHETSNVINVVYWQAGSNLGGQAATIGYQSAGGSAATAYPLVFDGKILDDNQPSAGWSIAPLPVCGNGVVDTKEQCDQGTANGTAGSCCTSTCTLESSGAMCRAGSGDACDPAETCSGTSASCPADVVQPDTFTCRTSAGECDVAESCTGVAGQACPADVKEAAGTSCTDDGNPCSLDSCDGSTDACQHPAGNAGTVCRVSTGSCDVDETCTGASIICPADGFEPPATVCRAAAGECDAVEHCTGSSATCPTDAKQPTGTGCADDGNPCSADRCDGSSDACQHPAGNAGALCRAVAGSCDVGELCDGTSTACPADAKSTAECRAAAGVCDVAESCDGVGDDCPADVFTPATTECHASAGVCDPAENCTGSSAACPGDGFASSATVCRAAAGICDLVENCTGSTAACPADAKSTAECRASAGVCDVAESCDGVGDDCPADAFTPSTTECRASAGLCDPAENCTGSSAACPGDGVASSATVCRAAAGICDLAENCTGSTAACPADAKSTAECRASADVCDVAESCDGVTDDCPSDTSQPDGTGCHDGQTCTVDDTCVDGQCVGSMPCGDGIAQSTCGEECDDGNTSSGDGCSDTCQLEFLCTPAPLPDCRGPVQPGKSMIQVKEKTPDAKDRLKWKWTKGAATTKAEFGTPGTTTGYLLCIYDADTLVTSVLIPADGQCAGKPCWKETTTGFKYKNRDAAPDGVTNLSLKEGIVPGNAKIQLKAMGANIDMPALPMTQPVLVQLRNSANGVCWESTFSTPAQKNDGIQYKDKSD